MEVRRVGAVSPDLTSRLVGGVRQVHQVRIARLVGIRRESRHFRHDEGINDILPAL